MANTVHSAAALLIAVLAMTLGMDLSPIGLSPAHQALTQVAAHLEGDACAAHLQCAEVDKGGLNEQGSKPFPSHDPADHSHETLARLAVASLVVPITERGWKLPPTSFSDLETSSRLDRPPSSILLA